MEKRFKRSPRLWILLVIAMVLATMVPWTNHDIKAADYNFTFAVTSDIQGYSGSSHDLPQYFRGLCEKIASLGNVTFMVSPGDLDPPSDVNWTVRQYLGQDFLWYPCAGNHDEETPSDMAWLRSYNYDLNGPAAPNIVNTGPSNGVETSYSFDYENSHFVVLNEYYNGSSDTGTDGDVVDALYNWLAADLNATNKAHIFVFGHEPAYPQPDADNGVLRHKGDSLDKYPTNRDRFWNLLRDKNVVAYFHGHTHSYSAVKTNGVWELDSGHSQGAGETGTRSTFLMIHVNGDVVTFDAYRDNYNGGPYTVAHSGTLTEDPTPSTIAVTDFDNYRVFQRDIGGTSKSVTISGTYANMDWSRVEARVLRHGTDTSVVDWTTIDSTPGGGIFSGTLIVPQGGWYNIETRALDGAGSVLGSSRGTNKWGVGMLILGIGQSNMSGHGQPPFTVATSDLAVNYSNAGIWEHLADPWDDGSPAGAVDNDNSTAGGSMIPALANSLLQTFNFPIAFVPSPKDGTNLYSQWVYRNPSNHSDTSTLYGQSITKAQRVGGVELIIMHQGEADTNDHRTEAQYEADFATLIGNYRQDLYPTIPIFICQLGTITLGTNTRTDADVQAVRNAQHDLDNGMNIFMAATAMDQPRLDAVHYTCAGLDAIGGRMAQAIKYHFGAASYYRGPSITSAFFAGNRNTVDIQIVHRGGNDITPASGMTGFSVLSNGSPVGITSAQRSAADRVRLTLASAVPQGATVKLRYLWGSDPQVTTLVKDNSSLALPLENTTADVTVTSSNTPPVAVNDSYNVNEDIALLMSAPGVLGNDSDTDGDTLTAVRVSNPAHGALTLNANGSFTYIPNSNYNGTDSFTYQASDGQANSNTATVTISVNTVNDPPLAVNDGYNVTQGTVLTVNSPGVLANDSDVDSNPLTAVLASNVSNGTLGLNSNGSFNYTPNSGYTGNDSFTYRANDGTANSDIATVTITVTASSSASFGLNSGDVTSQDSPNYLSAIRFQNTAGTGILTKLEILIDDTSPAGMVRLGIYADNNGLPSSLLLDAGVITVANGWVAKNGLSLQVTQGAYYWLVYDLNSNNGVRYKTGQPGNSNRWIAYTYGAFPGQYPGGSMSDNTQTVMRATVSIGNTPPVAINDNYTAVKDTPLIIATPGVLVNDTDVNGDPLTANVVNGAGHGSISLNSNGSFTYTPNSGYIGNDSFSYKANDGKADSNVATVTITVASPNNPPTAVNDAYILAEDNTIAITAPGVLGNDRDADGDSLTAIKVTNPAHGVLTLNANGSFTYTPSANYNGSDFFTYKANDGKADSNTATVTITINAVNDTPVAVNDAYNVVTGTTLTVTAPGVLANDTDADGDPLTAVLVSGVSHGVLTLNSNGSFTFTPGAGYTGSDSFTYKVNDTKADSNTVTATITVTASVTTFGLNAGNGTTNESRYYLNAMRFQNSAGTGTMTKLEILFNDTTPNGKVRLGVFADNSGVPGACLLDAGEVTVANGWVSISGLNLPVTKSYYWLAFNLQNSNGVRYQSGRPTRSHYRVYSTYGALPGQFSLTGASYNSNQYVMRATVIFNP